LPEQFNSSDYEFQQIFGKNNRLDVPSFQRSYSWRTENVETLWQDLQDFWFSDKISKSNLPEYFLGSIVTVEEDTGREILLDGQQRLATLTILASVIRDRLKELGGDKALIVANSTHQLLIARSAAWETAEEYKLVLNQEDREYFIRTVQRDPVEKVPPKLLSHKLIAKARRVLQKCVSEYLKDRESADRYRALQVLVKAIASAIVLIKIKVRNEDDASSIFEVLNDRGLDLGTEDLLRNYLLYRSHPTDRASIMAYWDDILGQFTKGGIQSFLRHSWISRYPVVSKKNTYREIKARISAPEQTLQFAQTLAADAAIYAAIAGDGAVPELKAAALRKKLVAFNVLRARQCMPLLLAVYDECVDELSNTLSKINTITFRYNICERNPNQLEGQYSELAVEIRKIKNDRPLIAETIDKRLKPLLPSDDEFVNGFRGVVVERADLQRYILGELEREIGNHEEFILAGPSEVHVEHIFPQTIGTGWDDMELSHNALGNLTLLAGGPNREISNSAFSKKVKAYELSKIVITKMLTEYAHWNEETIRKRQDQFALLAPAIWAY
jgi:hypothetical protein